MKNYYQILGIELNATEKEIKSAYRFLASKYHPDKHQGDSFFSEKFIEIKEAFDILSDPTSRFRYNSSFNSNNQAELDELLAELQQKKREFEEKEKDLKQREQKFSQKEFKTQQREWDLNHKEEKLREKEKSERIAWEREKARKEEQKLSNEKKNRDAKRRNVVFSKGSLIINEEYIDLHGSIIPLKKCSEVVLYYINQKKKRRLGYAIILISGILFVIFPIVILGLFTGFYYAFYRDKYLLKVLTGFDSKLIFETKNEFKAENLKAKLNKLIYEANN